MSSVKRRRLQRAQSTARDRSQVFDRLRSIDPVWLDAEVDRLVALPGPEYEALMDDMFPPNWPGGGWRTWD